MKRFTTEKAVCALFIVLTLATVFCSANRDGDRSKRPSRSLSAEVINSTTITLKWPAPAPTTAAGGADCPVRRYLIRLKHQGVKRVRTWKVDGARLSVSLHGLMPDTTYNVRLVVVNCEGRSKPSRWVVVRTSSSSSSVDQSYRIGTGGGGGGGGSSAGGLNSETSAPGLPRRVTSRAFSDYVIVSWEPPEDGAEVRGYVIGYGEGVPDVNWQYLEGHRRNVTVKNLKKLTQYVISVRAFNNVGKGPVVYDLVYTIDTPSQVSGSLPAPTNLRSKVLSPTTVWLQWSDTSLGRQQTVTDNRYYNVRYQTTNNGNDKTVVVKELHVVLYNLLPATTYEFKVGLVKDGLNSAFSDVVVNRTMETAPSSPPRSVTVTRLSSDPSTAIVSWRPPKQTNGNITDYTIYYTLNVELPYERWQTANVRQRTDFALQGLNDSVTYYFRVQARNSVGPGPKSDIVKYDTRTTPVVVQGPTRGPQPTTDVDTGSSRHVIALNETEEDDYDYTETDKEDNNDKNGGGEAIQSASLVHETGDSAAAAGKMKREPNLGPFLTDVTTTTTSDPDDLPGDPSRPPFVQFRVVLSYKVNAFVTWPETPGGADCGSPGAGAGAPRKAVGYRLRYRRADETGEYVTRSLADNLVLIENLVPNAKYKYQVKYVMEGDGETPWSRESELDTSADSRRRN